VLEQLWAVAPTIFLATKKLKWVVIIENEKNK
jgi:hypothetical protein